MITLKHQWAIVMAISGYSAFGVCLVVSLFFIAKGMKRKGIPCCVYMDPVTKTQIMRDDCIEFGDVCCRRSRNSNAVLTTQN